jgi:hypothetical protein
MIRVGASDDPASDFEDAPADVPPRGSAPLTLHFLSGHGNNALDSNLAFGFDRIR